MSKAQMYISMAHEVAEYLVHMFGQGNLTVNGVQYGTQVLSNSTETAREVDIATVDPLGISGDIDPSLGGVPDEKTILEVEFGLTAKLQNNTTDAATKVIYQWQAKECSSDTWVALTSALSTALGTTGADGATETTWSGRFEMVTNFTKVPSQIRLTIYAGTAGAATQLAAKTKNSSYVKVIYRVT